MTLRAGIALVDYGAGNLTSVRKGFAAVGAGASAASESRLHLFTPAEPAALDNAAAIVIPGVGHFAATAALTEPWKVAIRGAVGAGRPLLGICLGLQWLFEGSDEAPDVPGLSLVAGRCSRLPAGQRVPHVGWNSIAMSRSSRLLQGIADGTQLYFTHSYAAPVTIECVAITTHGTAFASVVELGSVFGVQFHPEKSGLAGVRVLQNFLTVVRES